MSEFLQHRIDSPALAGPLHADRVVDIYTAVVFTVAAVSSVLAFYSLGVAYQVLLSGVVLLLVGRRALLTPWVRSLAFLFVLNLILILIASIYYNENPSAIMTVIVRYWSPIAYGALLLVIGIQHGHLYYWIWFRLLLVLTACAYLQYFFSPTLWGIIPTDYSTLTEWAEGKSFEEYSLFYRATSLMGSPQVWGLYSALSIFVLSGRLRGGISYPVQVFLWMGCLLSGNKVSALIMIIFMMYRSTRRMGYFLLSASVGLFAIIFAGSEEIQNFRAIEHILNVGDIGAQERGGRLSIWEFILGDINLFLGGGASYVQQLSASRNFVAESYILQSWIEVTALFPLVFLSILGRQLFARQPDWEKKFFIVLVFISATVSHTFSHPAFIIFWPMLLGIPAERKT